MPSPMSSTTHLAILPVPHGSESPPQGGRRDDHDWVRLKVVAQLPPSDEDNIQKLLDLWVACLGVGQDFTDEVYWTLDFEGMIFLLPFHYYGGTHYLSSARDV
jgi:hypothetical protein